MKNQETLSPGIFILACIGAVVVGQWIGALVVLAQRWL